MGMQTDAEKEATMRAIGARVKGAREKQGLNHNQVGRMLGISGQRVAEWEEGTSAKLYFLDPLAKILKVNIAWLISGTGRP